MQPADVHTCIRRSIGGNGISRVGFNQFHLPVSAVPLELQFTDPDIPYAAKKLVREPVGFGIIHRLDHTCRAEIDGTRPDLPQDATSQSATAPPVTRHVD